MTLLLNGPTEDQIKKIKEELNEDDDRLAHNLELLKTWLSFQTHLPQKFDPRLLTNFLRGCKHDIEKAKRKIEMYFTVRTTIPEIFANRDTTSKECMETSKILALVPMKQLNHDGTRVSIYKLMSSDASLYNIVEVVRLFCIMGDIRLTEEKCIAGDILIMDTGNNLTATHVVKTLNYSIIAKGMTVANEAYPQRVKRFHFVNFPDFGEKIVALLKSFTKEKIRNRFIIHKTTDDLLDYIDPAILPNEYGGTAGDFATMHEEWQQYYIEKRDWIKEQEKIVGTGPIPKHLMQSCALDSCEGLQGSFRKLAID